MMRTNRYVLVLGLLLGALLSSADARAAFTVYFDPAQVATFVGAGTTTDTISCEGYLFIYTRDKLFTGGGPVPIGRPVRVAWPTGVEAQYVTAGPNPGKATITVRRVDGALFDIVSFTARLLANAGAGRTLEIVPKLNGEEPFNDPFPFDMSGMAGNEFSYDRSPNPWGTTAPLVGFDTYVMGLTLDYALTALTLESDAPVSGVGDEPPAAGAALLVTPNPARGPVTITVGGTEGLQGGTVTVFDVAGALVRTLRLDGSGRSAWDLRDAAGRPAAAGLYFVRGGGAPGPAGVRRLLVLR
jgi:hypothetical protein